VVGATNWDIGTAAGRARTFTKLGKSIRQALISNKRYCPDHDERVSRVFTVDQARARV